MGGEPHWRQLERSTELRSVVGWLLNVTMLSFCLVAMNRKPAVPLCSQVSKESRWELVQKRL